MSVHTADVVIVGAGPAGCGAAYDLARAGCSVLLLDKAAFPRVKPCAGGITIKSLKALRYDISPVIQRRCSNLRVGLFPFKDKLLRSKTPVVAMTVRAEFDAYCLNRCIEIGASFQQIGAIQEVARDEMGWTVVTKNGLYRGAYLIGADGANSRVRQLLSRGKHVRFGMALEAEVPVADPGAYEMGFDFGAVERGYGWVFPKGDHLNVGLYSLKQFRNARERLRAYCLHRVGIEPKGEIVGHRIPFNGQTFQPLEEDVFLIGDAAGLIDPMLGEGIFNAIRSGQIAAEVILALCTGRKAAYRRAIREVTRDLGCYWLETRAFYKKPKLGYLHLTLPPISYILMKGFAMGWTIREIKRRFATLPFRKPEHYLVPSPLE